MGMLPLDQLKRQWARDMTAEQAVGQIIQHLEAFGALIKERGQTLKSLVKQVETLTDQVSKQQDRLKLLEQQWGEAKRAEGQEEPAASAAKPKGKAPATKRKE